MPILFLDGLKLINASVNSHCVGLELVALSLFQFFMILELDGLLSEPICAIAMLYFDDGISRFAFVSFNFHSFYALLMMR